MTKGRARMIAVQALIVGALALAVVLTVLRPEGDDPLFGVSTREPDTGVIPAEPPRDDRERDLGFTDRDRDRADRGPSQPGARTFAGTVATGPAAVWTPPATSAGGGSTPTADQYDNTLARLAAKLD